MKTNRREFIKTSATGLSLAILGLSPLASCGIPEDSPYMKSIGVQLYTLRNQFATDPKGVLKAIAKFGYKQVETFDPVQYLDHKSTFQELGLKTYSSHINWKLLFDEEDLSELSSPQQKGFDHLLEVAHKEGLSHLVVAWLPEEMQKDMEVYRKMCTAFNEKGERCKKAGIKLAYHNHSFEFQSINGITPYDLMLERIDPDNMQFELDVFWSSVAGIEPVGLMKKMKSRICLLHLKDKLAGTPNSFDTNLDEAAYKELGQGVVDIQGVLAAAPEAGVDYCMVEQDHSPDPIKSIGISMDYLNTA